MTIPTTTLLPANIFRHIGVMILFMSILLGIAAFGFVAVSTIIRGWTKDIENTMSIEIPAFDGQRETVHSQEYVNQSAKQITLALQNDPAITRINITTPDTDQDIDPQFNIPVPAFITVTLHPARADNTEQRIVENIKTVQPAALIKAPSTWVKDIESTARTLQLVFTGLAASIIAVTTFVIIGVVRTQLKSSMDTVNLIHLLGAPASTISALFRKAVTTTVARWCFFGLAGLGFAVSPLVVFLDYQGSVLLFWGLLPIILCVFILLSAVVTSLTVSSALREMP